MAIAVEAFSSWKSPLILGFGILGLGVSSLVPIAYSIAGSVKNIDKAVGISIISISVYGVFISISLYS